MTKTIDALVEALEALRPLSNNALNVHPDWDDNKRRNSLTGQTPITVGDCRKAAAAVASINSALAQARAEQAEPVYQYQLSDGSWIDIPKGIYDADVKVGKATVRVLYTTPPAAPVAKLEPLTDAEIRPMCKQDWVFETVKQWVRAVEAAHNAKLGGASA